MSFAEEDFELPSILVPHSMQKTESSSNYMMNNLDNNDEDYINERKVNDDEVDNNIQEGNFDEYGYNDINDKLNNMNIQGSDDFGNNEEQFNNINANKSINSPNKNKERMV